MMQKNDVLHRLHEKVCDISFEKADGVLRLMKATLYNEFLPPRSEETVNREPKKPNPDVQVIFDMESKAWRSFRWDKLKSCDGETFYNKVIDNDNGTE